MINCGSKRKSCGYQCVFLPFANIYFSILYSSMIIDEELPLTRCLISSAWKCKTFGILEDKIIITYIDQSSWKKVCFWKIRAKLNRNIKTNRYTVLTQADSKKKQLSHTWKYKRDYCSLNFAIKYVLRLGTRPHMNQTWPVFDIFRWFIID